MASTHTSRTIRASASLAAATAANGTEWNNSTTYGGIINVLLTNGASAPTTAPRVDIYTGHATGEKKLFYTATGDIVNNSVTNIACEIPPTAMFVNVTITNGATNAITAEAYAQELTTV